MDPEEWEMVSDELARLVGEVTLQLTDLEDSLDYLILDLLAAPPMRQFFQRRFLDGRGMNYKAELLRAYVKDVGVLVVSADTAMTVLDRVVRVNKQRNRLVHDLHVVDDESGGITRRRLGAEEAAPVDITDYASLSGEIAMLASPGMDALADALQPAAADRPEQGARHARAD